MALYGLEKLIKNYAQINYDKKITRTIMQLTF